MTTRKVAVRRLLSHEALTRSQREALGSVVAESSYMERSVEMCISLLAGINEELREAFLTKAMVGAKLDLMAELAGRRLQDEAQKKTMRELVNRLKECNTERATAVHGVWFPETAPVRRTRGHHPRGRIMTVDQLTALGKKISEAHWDLLQFRFDVLEHLSAPAK